MKHFWTLTIPLAIAGGSLAQGQDASKLNARELFYSPPAQVSTPSATPPGTGAAHSSTSAGAKGAAKPGTTPTSTSTTTSTTATASNSAKTSLAPSNNTAPLNNATPVSNATQASKGTAAGNAAPATNGTIVASVGQGNPAVNTSGAAANGPLGLRYAILKRESAAFHEVDPETKFRTGDSIRLNVTPSTSGYLYVVQQGASGIWTLLFPRPEVKEGSNFVEKGQMLAVPSEKAMWTFDAHAGEEKLFLVLARQPEPDLDKLIYSIGAADPGAPQKLVAQAKVRDDVVNRLRQQMLSRDLVFEKVDESTTDSTGKAETAAYVVSKNPAPDARLVKDLTLSHQ